MNMIEKNKNLFIITLEDGNQTYFNFTDGKIYEVNGEPVQHFNNKARKILKAEKDNNFLAWFFFERDFPYSFYGDVSHWSLSMVETLYSLFANRYSAEVLLQLAIFCHENSYVLDKKGIKILTNCLLTLEEADGKIYWVNQTQLKSQIMPAFYNDIPQFIVNILLDINDEEMRSIIIADAKKIAFYYEHENWIFLLGENEDDSESLRYYLTKYIELCEFLHKERTYKNLYLSICHMEKEKDLIMNDICIDYQKNAALFFEDENFTVIIPTTAKEFREEADYQHNCVFRLYYPKVKNRETHIVFIRKKNNINIPYITCEIGNNGKIIQYLERFNNCTTNNKALSFRAKYQQFLQNNF